MHTLVLTVRGALAFGLAAAIAFGSIELILKTAQFSSLFVLPLLFVPPFLAGAAAAALFTPNQSGTASSGAFGCGFVVIWAAVAFAHVSIQGGGRPDFGWAALAGGVSFAIAGAAGGAAIDVKLLVPGALFFGIAGALGAAFSFFLTTTAAAPWGLVIAMTGSGIVAGAMLGAYVGFSGLDEWRSGRRS